MTASSSDCLNTGVMQAATAEHIAIPEELRIVGYDVDTMLQPICSAYTSISQPLEQMIALALSHLLKMIETVK